VSSDALSDLFTNTLPFDPERYMSVDVARKGEDRTVISLWRGLELYSVELRTKQGTDVTERQIKDLAASERIPYSKGLKVSRLTVWPFRQTIRFGSGPAG
jgi:hypothetical protein